MISTVKLEAFHHAQWNEVTGYYGGTFNMTPNASARLEVTFPNKGGVNLNALHMGQFIRLSLGLDGLLLYPRFLGFMANRQLTMNPESYNVSFECFDLLGEAQREMVKFTELGPNLDGMDAGAAVKWLLTTLYDKGYGSVPSEVVPPNVDAVCGLPTPRIIVPEDGFYTPEYGSKLQLLQTLNDMSVVDQYPNPPKPFILFVDGEGRFHHQPVTDIAAGVPRLTIAYSGNLNKFKQASRSAKLITECIVTGIKDPNDTDGNKFIGSFLDSSWMYMEGLWTQKFNKTWCKSIDDCRDYAMRKVALYRELYEPISVETRRGHYVMVGDLVGLTNTQSGKDENMRVMEVDVTFQPTDFSCKLTLGAMNYLPTDYI
jgi:hypothetical protein